MISKIVKARILGKVQKELCSLCIYGMENSIVRCVENETCDFCVRKSKKILRIVNKELNE